MTGLVGSITSAIPATEGSLSNVLKQSFSGIGRLVGQPGIQALQAAHVVVVGVGGVGSWTVEALVRSGIGQLTLVDPDDICVTNINRQLQATTESVGKVKVDELAKRIRLINPDCQVRAIQEPFDATWSENFFSEIKADYIVDAIDSVSAKVHLIAESKKRQVPIIAVGGAAGVFNPNLLMVDDLNFSYNDGLLRRVRRRLRDDHGFTSEKVAYGIPCVFSAEKARLTDGTSEKETSKDLSDEMFENLRSNRNCENGFGTATFITGSMGFFAAAIVVRNLTIDRP